VKRSGGVTAAAIVLLAGSTLLVLMAAAMILASVVATAVKAPNVLGPGIFYVEAGCELALASWGIATAVGILQLRSWARISILVMSGIAAGMALLCSLGMILVVPILRQQPNTPPGLLTFVLVFELVLFGIPLAIAIWWLILFTRKSVGMQFASQTRIVAPEPLVAFQGGIVTSTSATVSLKPQIPVSIILIAAFLLLGASFMAFTVSFAVRTHAPFILLGVLQTGRASLAAILAMGVIQLALGIALLQKRLWSLDAAIAYGIVAVLNGLLFFVSRARETYFSMILRSYPPTPGVPPQFMEHMMRTILPFSLGLGTVLDLVALYFLVTRRRAYREACAAKA
jgi:hypothetical protein